MGRNTKLKKNYKPLSEKFIRSIIKNSGKTDLNIKEDLKVSEQVDETIQVKEPTKVKEAKVKEAKVKIKEKEKEEKIQMKDYSSYYQNTIRKITPVNNNNGKATLRRNVNNKGAVTSFVVTFGVESVQLYTHRPFFEVFVELLHYKFQVDTLMKYFNISSNTLQMLFKENGYNFADYSILICCVPKNIKDCKGILEFIDKELSQIVLNCPDAIELHKKYAFLSEKKANFCITYFQNRKKNVADSEGVNKVVKKVCNVKKEDLKDVVSSAKNSSKVEDLVVNVVERNLIQAYEQELKVEKGLPIEEYVKVLKLEDIVKGINISTVVEDLKKKLQQNTLDEILAEYEKNYAVFLYILFYKFNLCREVYKSEFYPAEDKILEEYYKDVGVKVVDIMTEVIPNYVPKSNIEYLMRIREKGYKTCHINLGFDILSYDLDVLYLISEKIKSGLSKYIFWIDYADLVDLAEMNGITIPVSKKKKKDVNYNNIDIAPYITKAKALKEVVNHSGVWTSYKHDFFKKYFKTDGYAIAKEIGVSEEECRKHSLSYKVYQDYTTIEVKKMQEVYEKEGMEGLIREFPHRTKKALKYKVEEQGWSQGNLSIDVEKLDAEIEELVEKRVEERKIEFLEQVREEEADKIRKKVRKEEVSKIEEETTNRLRKVIEKEIYAKTLKEVKPKIISEYKAEVSKLLRASVTDFFKDSVPQIVEDTLKSCTLSDILNSFTDNVVHSVENEVQRRISKVLTD